uniref:Ribosomal protein L34e superfamily protein n=1 Tax=Davidia involucrata TaxID=16924 RepID=A0A5B6YM22_DAVIN
MCHHLLSSIIMAPSSSSSSPSLSKPNNHNKKPSPSNPTHCSSSSSSSLLCKHSPSATLDILILILVLFSGTFLITSYLSYIFQSLSLILPSLLLSHSTTLRDSPIPYLLAFLLFFVAVVVAFEICCGYRSRKCDNPGCKGMKKAMEFDLQLQTEECLRSAASAVREIDELPWKGGSQGNPDYECLRAELRKMAPPNGRAVLLFRAKCGCPVAKLEGWGAKRGRRHKKSLALNGGDHR